MSEIKAGDVVKLKSGGPKMTVTYIGNYSGIPKADCSWFDPKDVKLGSATFALEALIKA